VEDLLASCLGTVDYGAFPLNCHFADSFLSFWWDLEMGWGLFICCLLYPPPHCKTRGGDNSSSQWLSSGRQSPQTVPLGVSLTSHPDPTPLVILGIVHVNSSFLLSGPALGQ
jgi:hypothetical protein